MHDRSVVPEFRPTEAWYSNWPFGVSTSVQVRATISGPAAARAVREFLKPLKRSRNADVADGVSLYYWGGFTAEVTPPVGDGAWQVVLASAGQDGFDSLQSAADDLVAALRATSDTVFLVWHELAATRAG